ncbi:MAG: peptidoglycan endopeptidase [Luteolibacter sp.]|uniref:peptidoglycan endopeptidase n=1 Tax=Luteolibacter sp. TaxID=1962973 RepID=UPI003266B746
MKGFLLLLTVIVPISGGLVSCSSQVKARQPVSYHFQYGRTAMLKDGIAYAPKNAPAAVKRAIAAGNRLQNMPYKWGGGHAHLADSGYDCSGTVSYVLREAGLMKGCLPSKDYFGYGKKGEGKWITIYARNGHVFMTVAGLRLDTGGPGGESGPRWKTATRQGVGHVMRHPSGY